MRRIFLALPAALIGLLLTVWASPATGQTFSITIPDGVNYEPENTVLQLASAPVDPDLIGQSCNVIVSVFNNTSLHPGNDLLIASNGSEVVATNVENQPGNSTHPAAGVLTLGSTVTVSLRFGPDGIRSEGYTVNFECTPAPPPPPPPPPEPPSGEETVPPPATAVTVAATPSFTG
jgi:hypothetical protein